MHIGEAIRTLRKNNNLTQRELAKRAGMSSNALCYLEQGKTFPPMQTISAICGALEITQAFLLLYAIEESDLPEDKRMLYNLIIKPLKKSLWTRKPNSQSTLA